MDGITNKYKKGTYVDAIAVVDYREFGGYYCEQSKYFHAEELIVDLVLIFFGFDLLIGIL